MLSFFSVYSKFLGVTLNLLNIETVSFCVITVVNGLNSNGSTFKIIAINKLSLIILQDIFNKITDLFEWII